MRQGKGSFTAGLLVGVIAGLAAGVVTVAHSTTGKKAWHRFGSEFQAGYISGFLDCVRIAKATDQEGYVARNFRLPPNAKPTQYQAWIAEAYTDPKNADKTIPQLLVLAGYKLEAVFGPEALSNDLAMEGLRSAVESRRTAYREAEAARQALEAEKAADAAKAAEADNTLGGAPAATGKAADAPPPAK